VATLPSELTVPPWEVLPPVATPPVEFDEQLQTTMALAKATTGASHRATARRELRPGYQFVTDVPM
jgi:hypothetical protein